MILRELWWDLVSFEEKPLAIGMGVLIFSLMCILAVATFPVWSPLWLVGFAIKKGRRKP